MTTTPRRAVLRGGAAVLLAAGLAACAGPQLDEAHLVADLRTQLSGQGVTPDDLDCPADLPAEVGRSVRCSFTVDGQPVDAVATVQAVDGADVVYDLHTEARPVVLQVLERSVAEQLARAGAPAGTASCVGELPAEVDATVGCRLTGPSGASDWTVRTTSVDGGRVGYSIEQVGLS